jgi:peptidoglycan/xylan/chitin deacetylase (PgdA/CDA1 family)
MKRISLLLATLFVCSLPLYSADQKLIALTFDDGPRPYILYGRGNAVQPPVPGLLDLLDQDHVKATFFVMGWRLRPGVRGEKHEFDIGRTCREGAEDAFRHGHEIENHTFSHEQLRLAEKEHGDAWVLNDVDKASVLIKQITGEQPRFVRPPDWIMWPQMKHAIEARGYHVMSIFSDTPVADRDVNSADYLCTGAAKKCPKPSLEGFVLQQIAQRERHGVYTHILAFHELTSTVTMLETLIPELQKRGYRFVRLDEYVRLVDGNRTPGATTAAR